MKSVIICFFIIAILASCGGNAKNTLYKHLSLDNIPQQIFDIDTKRDTVVTTNTGTVITIVANSISAEQQRITLQVKEAHSIEQMVAGRLFTETSEGLLSSAGMIKISTKEKSSLNKAIGVAMPAKFTKSEMKLYKGDDIDGKIVWEDPKPLETSMTELTLLGVNLFESLCASCHAINKDLTAPALAHIEKRRTKEWLYAFTRSSSEVLHSGDGYTCCIYNKWNKTNMPDLQLTEKELDAIYNYIEKASDSLNVSFNHTRNNDCDSCNEASKYLRLLSNSRDSLIRDNGKMVEETIVQPNGQLAGSSDTTGLSEKVEPPVYAAEYYKFSVTAYGWYNVDMLLKETKGVEMSELRVRMNVPFDIHINVSLIIPATKTFAEGGNLEGGTEFGFYNQNGEIPLPQQTEAFIIAMGEGNGKIYFGKQSFVTSTKQVVNIAVGEMSREMMLQSIQSLQLDSMRVEVSKTKNFNSIKEIDKEMRRFGEKCSCASDTAKSGFPQQSQLIQ
jgi:hypothetical protein